VKKEFFEKARPSSLLKRFEKPQEVAAVAFVTSARDPIINGAALQAEGGVCAPRSNPPAANNTLPRRPTMD